MVLYALWSFVATVVILKIVDWGFHDWKHATYVRTRLFGLATLLALVTVVLFGISFL